MTKLNATAPLTRAPSALPVRPARSNRRPSLAPCAHQARSRLFLPLQLRIPEGRLQLGRLAPISPDLALPPSAPAPRPRAQVTFVDSEGGASRTVACPESEFLLDSAEAAGVALPSSCRGGLCGSCVARLHEGRVDMDTWADGMEIPITVEQLQAGYILVCVGRRCGPRCRGAAAVGAEGREQRERAWMPRSRVPADRLVPCPSPAALLRQAADRLQGGVQLRLGDAVPGELGQVRERAPGAVQAPEDPLAAVRQLPFLFSVAVWCSLFALRCCFVVLLCAVKA